MNNLMNFFKGMAVGVANIIPGVSGGTMAVILHMYDELIESISTFFKDWKKNLLYLIPIGLGAIVGIVAFSKIVKYLLENYPMATNFFFIGLIVGSCPLIFNKAKEGGIKKGNIIPFIITFAFIVAISVINPPEENAKIITTLTLNSFITLALTSMIGAVAMIIPGLSGSFILLILGVYTTIITAIADMNVLILVPVAIGVALGILGGSKAIDILIKKYKQGTYMAILGFVVGSIFAIYPGFVFGAEGIVSIIVLAIGAAMAYFLGSNK